jgi:hypothetical protein
VAAGAALVELAGLVLPLGLAEALVVLGEPPEAAALLALPGLEDVAAALALTAGSLVIDELGASVQAATGPGVVDS